MSLEEQVSAVEQRVASLPRVLDDETIIEVLSAPSEYPGEVSPALFELFRKIGPALVASYERGVIAWRFCTTRRIVRPRPVGSLDRFAWGTAFSRESMDNWDWHQPYESFESRYTNQGLRIEENRISLREGLVWILETHLQKGALPVARMRMSDEKSGLPILNQEEALRLLNLIEPLQLSPDPDLPLLVWQDRDQGGVMTSWPNRGLGRWTPIDVGLTTPAYFLLAHPADRDNEDDEVSEAIENTEQHRTSLPVDSSGQPQGKPPVQEVLKRGLPALGSLAEDSEIIKRIGEKYPIWGTRQQACRSLYQIIERPLRASVLIGAAGLRSSRARGVDPPEPQSAIDLVAMLISYPSLSDMPSQLANQCGRFTAESSRYDLKGYGLTLGPPTGDETTTLLFILVEHYGIQALRNHDITIDDVPVFSPDQSERMRALVSPLEDDQNSHLPLLVWRDPKGAIQSSRPATGQMWTKVDI